MINTGNDVNCVSLTGNLMCDVTWKTNENNERTVGFFAVGTARKLLQEFVTDRHSIVVKGPLVKNFPNIKKGDRVSIQGVLSYTKKVDSKYPTAEIKLESIKKL